MRMFGKNLGGVRWLVGLGAAAALLAGSASGMLLEWYQRRERMAEAATVMHRLERRVGEYQMLLLGLRGLFDTFGGISSGAFNQYIDSLGLEARYPGILRLEYVERIPDGLVPAARGVPVYRPADDPAFDGASPRFHLVSERLALSEANAVEIAGFGRVGTVTDGASSNRRGLAYRMPVFVPGAPLESVEERRAAYLGAVGAWLDLEKLFRDALADGSHEAFVLRVSMARPEMSGVATQHALVFESAATGTPGDWLLRQQRVEFADHGFHLALFALPEQGVGALRAVLVGVSVGGLLLTFTFWGGATLRAREERRLRDHERMLESFNHRMQMGELTIGLAHELQQPLQGIRCGVDTLQIASEAGSLTREGMDLQIEKVQAEIERADGRLAQIRALSVDERPARGDEAVAVEELFAEFRAFFLREARHFPYDFIVCPPERPWCVHGELFPLEGVLSNLARNALQAMRDAGMARGSVTVQAKHVEGEGRLSIVVADTGPGLPKERLAHLFERFSSTKAGGMGIGLSLGHRTMQRYRGKLVARNRPEGGAEFTLELPLTGTPPAVPIPAAD